MSIHGPSASPTRFPELRPSRPAAGAPSAEPNAPAAAVREQSLWEVLTDEERAFFSQQSALGSLSYGKPRGSLAPSAPTGQRLDVRA